MVDYNESDVKYWWTLSNERISCATGITIEKGNLINQKCALGPQKSLCP